MPNEKGWRKPNGSWDESSAERRAQKAAAAQRFRERRKNNPAFQTYLQEKKQESRARLDPNKPLERARERRFRFTATENNLTQLVTIFSYVRVVALASPKWLVVKPSGERVKDWLEPEEDSALAKYALGGLVDVERVRP